jgi:uncharacterized coiled-coil DUF342 family protein
MNGYHTYRSKYGNKLYCTLCLDEIQRVDGVYQSCECSLIQEYKELEKKLDTFDSIMRYNSELMENKERCNSYLNDIKNIEERVEELKKELEN